MNFKCTCNCCTRTCCNGTFDFSRICRNIFRRRIINGIIVTTIETTDNNTFFT